MSDLLLKNVTAVFSDKVAGVNSISIANGKIAAFDAEVSDVEKVIDLAGAHIFAGFIDIHNHGAVGFDCNEADADGLHEVSKFLAKSGVTAWLPTFVPDSVENYQKCIAAVDELMRTQDEGREAAARVVGVHYEGPFVNEKQSGALRVQYFKNFANGDEIAAVPKLQAENAVHFTTLAPEIAGGVELIKELKRQGWVVSIGHTRADVETLEAACAAGARHITHFFNAMSGVHHREVGVAGWGLTNDAVTFDIIADKIHVHPQMLKFACRAKTPEKVVLISDCVSPTGLGDGDFTIWNEKVSVKNGKTQNERGSIAGSVITLHDAVGNMLDLGFTAAEISQMASLNPACVLGIDEDYGSIEPGKRADLTAIDANGNVVLTIIGGRVAFEAR
jgi:N-acetylglucosamine-6-phosphate deacetylase